MVEEVRASAPPKFNFEKALLARETADRRYKMSPALYATGSLWLYNSPAATWMVVLSRLEVLEETEREGAFPLLQTIGWEVESPRKLFTRSLNGKYALFFDLMGIPRNKVNADIQPGKLDSYGHSEYWEFSTHPAYSADLANRTLCELIKGNFIPHLEGSATDEDRHTLLDNKLVSLHINIGIPPRLTQRNMPVISESEDIKFLASSFEFAYTSSIRHAHRSQTVISNIRSAKPLEDQSDKEIFRLEVKALEVRDASTYRLMREIQLVAASTFAYVGGYNIPLATSWESIREDIKRIYEKYSVNPELITHHSQAAEKVKEVDFIRELRRVLTIGAQRIKLFPRQDN